MILYKLTDQLGYTYNKTYWEIGTTHETSGDGELCGPGWLHAYTDPLLAVLLNPINGNFKNPILWECEGDIGTTDKGLKVGCTKLTITKKLKTPKITETQRVAFAILCAITVYKKPNYIIWAENWLKNVDRTSIAAYNAANTTNAAYNTAYNAAHAAYNAANAAYNAAYNAANTAAYAAYNTAYNAANKAAKAAYADDYAAYAAYAADYAAYAADSALTLIEIAQEAMNY